MIILILFAFVAGIVTILSPCILPVLPIVLAGSVETRKKRPLGIVSGFILSFTFFTLFLSTIVKIFGISTDILRNISVFVLAGFGLSLLVPKLQLLIENFFSKLFGRISGKKNIEGYFGGLIVGLSLGLLWTPCVGPILASIITLAAANSVSGSAVLITLAYSIGTAIPMFAIMIGGRQLLLKIPWLLPSAGKIQKAFGVLMIITAAAIFLNFDRQFQTYIINRFPSYGAGLTKIEDNQLVRSKLNILKTNSLYQDAPVLVPGGQWFNSKPLKLADLRGKVVLIDFWTYTCINCIRTLPYVKNWYEKYHDKGLIVIGVHTPEFEFEKNSDNVAKAIRDFQIKYPVMQDNDYSTWNAYSNHYWPAKYFIDKNGKIRSTHFGEGEYDQSEKIIQKLLEEAGSKVENMPVNNAQYSVEAQTPETYLGALRRTDSNDLKYFGSWKVENERALPGKGASLEYNYYAKNVFLVMGSNNGKQGKIKIYLDGKLINQIEASDYRLYDIIKLKISGHHLLRLEFLDSNLELFAFTFG